MSFADDVKIEHTTVQRIVLYRLGRTTVDVSFYPDKERGTTNGEISINGDYGSFHYYWGATGSRLFADFLDNIAYDYAMGKLCGRNEAYYPVWDWLENKLKREVLSQRRDHKLSDVVARALYDYFNGDYLLDTFCPDSYESYLRHMEVELYLDLGRKERRHLAEDRSSDEVIPLKAMYSGNTEFLPEPYKEREHSYFWDEVWPVILREVRKVEEHSQRQIWGGIENVPGR